MQWVPRLIRQVNTSGKGAAFSDWSSDSPVEALSLPSTFVGRMKLYSINGPSAHSIFFSISAFILALSRRRQIDSINLDRAPRGKQMAPRRSC